MYTSTGISRIKNMKIISLGFCKNFLVLYELYFFFTTLFPCLCFSTPCIRNKQKEILIKFWNKNQRNLELNLENEFCLIQLQILEMSLQKKTEYGLIRSSELQT